MKIYRYRDLRPNEEISTQEALNRVYQIVLGNTHWCARPDALNDPDEFSIGYDYTVRDSTRRLLPGILAHYHGIPPERAVMLTSNMTTATLEEISIPVVADMVSRCREEVGLISFSFSKDDPILWGRYGGQGDGVCIEIDVPDRAIEDGTLRAVEYVLEKIWHIDSLFESALSDPSISFRQMLLTKTESWRPEKEARFVSKRQNVYMTFNQATITEVLFGSKVSPAVVTEIKAAVNQHLPSHSIAFTLSDSA